MGKIEFENEEQARYRLQEEEDFCESMDCLSSADCIECKISFLKEKGYLKKSALEIAIDHYKTYVSCARGFCDKDDGQYILIEQLMEAVDELKKETERLKNGK